LGRQIDGDLADNPTKLETVAGESGDDDYVFCFGVPVDDKVTVGRVREHAHLHRERWSVSVREIASNAFPKNRFILGVTVAIHGVSDN
jgi:hypothetical protein